MRIKESVRENDVFVVQSFSAPINDSIMEMLIMIDTIKRASAGRVTAVIPYFGYGRTDKKDQPRVPITARLVAKLVGVSGADRALLLDLHAGQIQGFFDVPVDEMSAMSLTASYFAQKRLPDPVVVSPDLGNTKRARNFAEIVDAPLAIIEKRRAGNQDRTEVLNLIGSVARACRPSSSTTRSTRRGRSPRRRRSAWRRARPRSTRRRSIRCSRDRRCERLQESPIREVVVTQQHRRPGREALLRS